MLMPQQVARVLGGEIIASYANTSQARPAAYGPRDAATVLMAQGRRMAWRDGAYYVDGARATPEDLDRLAGMLDPDGIGAAPPGPCGPAAPTGHATIGPGGDGAG